MKNPCFYFLILTSIAFCGEHGRFGVSMETPGFSLFSSGSSSGTINARFMIDDRFGLDAGVGMATISSVERDSSAQTEEQPAQITWTSQAAAVFKFLDFRDSDLFGILDFRWVSAPQSFFFIATDTVGNIKIREASYNRVTFEMGFFLEPNYLFSDHFALFFKFGGKIRFLGISRTNDPDKIYNSVHDEPKLIEKKDSRTALEIGPVASLGFRFYF